MEIKEQSKQLKKQLLATFPGVKFSVRSTHGSLYVNWTDFPAVDAVEEIAYQYRNVHTCDITGDILGGGNTFVFCNQEVTPELRAKAQEQMPEGITPYDVGYGYHFNRVMNTLWKEQCTVEEAVVC